MIRTFAIALTLALAFTVTASAEERLTYYYLLPNESGDASQTGTDLYFCGSFTTEEKVYMLFDNFFSDERRYCVPDGIEVLAAKISGSMLVLNVSKDILNYGGTYYELMLVKQLVMTAFGIPGIESFTLLIDGENRMLTEGNKIYLLKREDMTRLLEL